MANQLLLLQDVEHLGRSGDVVNAKPGYARNFLFPKKLAVAADANTLRMRARLQELRAKQAVEDQAEAQIIAAKVEGKDLQISVKIDPEGNMYGSVAAHDIVKILEREDIRIEKKNVALPHAIKTLGTHIIPLKLKEGVTASFTLQVVSEDQAQG